MDTLDRNLATPLFYAGNKSQVEVLVKAGANINAKNNKGQTALFWSGSAGIASGYVAAGIDVNARNIDGQTALGWARAEDIFDSLIEGGADITTRDNFGQTSLLVNVTRRETARGTLIDRFVQAGANIDDQDLLGLSLLHKVCQNCQHHSPRRVEAVVRARANVNI